MIGFNSSYILWVLIPTLILSIGAQALVSMAFARWTKTRNSAGLTGQQVAQELITSAGLDGVGLEGTPGIRSDHFDPQTNVVRMSQEVATLPSVASMAVVLLWHPWR